MNSQEYVVVNFLDTNEAGIINKKWLLDNGKCLWPPYRSTNHIIKATIDGTPEPDENWKEYDIVVYGTYDSYETAKRKESLALDTSNLESQSECEVQKKRSRKRIVPRVIDESNTENSSDSEEVEQPLLKKQAQLLKPRQFDNFNGCSVQPCTSRGSVLQANVSAGSTELTPLHKSFEKQILRSIAYIRKTMDEHTILLKKLVVTNSSSNPTESLPSLPLKNMMELENWEEYLTTQENFNQVVKFLGFKGGADAKQVVRRILSSVFSNELAIEFNWAGRRPKKAFKDLKTSVVLRWTA